MRYYIVHNTIEVFSYGEILEEQVVTTGYSNIEYFENMLSFTQRLFDFGIIYEIPLPTEPSDSIGIIPESDSGI